MTLPKDPALVEDWKRRISEKLKGRTGLFIPSRKGAKHSEESKKKMSLAHKKLGTKPPIGRGAPLGIKRSAETRRKLSEVQKRIWQARSPEERKKHLESAHEAIRGRKQGPEEIAKRAKSIKGYKHSDEARTKMSKSAMGKVLNENQRRGLEMGRHLTLTFEQRKARSERNKGEKCNFWKGGVSYVNRTERGIFMDTVEYKEWRRNIFERDDYTCQKCDTRGGCLHAHHIKQFKGFPELRMVVNNGITYCNTCHTEYHVINGR